MRPHPLQPRRACLRERLRDEGLGALVSFGAADCRYLTGFTGEVVAVITTGTEVSLLTDPRFTTQAEEEAPESKLVICSHDCDDQIPQILVESLQADGDGVGGVAGFDSDHLTVKRWERLRELLGRQDILQPTLVDGLVRRCRLVKFPDEIEAIRLAGEMAVQAFAYLETIPVVGRSERDVALDLEVFLRRNGSEGVAFPFIVAGGRRGALPHGAPSSATLERGGLLVLDIGAVTDGYSSDVTRTYAIGEVGADLVKAYETVRKAQALAVAAVRPGTPGKEIDEVARAHLRDSGMDHLFVHSLGHGVGLEVHEGPSLSPRSEDVLEAGMVVTVEPGIYLADRGGIRIEDTVVVTPEGADIVTDWPRELRTLSR